MNHGYGSTCLEGAPASKTDSSADFPLRHSLMGYSAQTQQPAMFQALYNQHQSPSVPFSNRVSPYNWTNSTTTNEVPFASTTEGTLLNQSTTPRYPASVTPESQFCSFSIGRLHSAHAGEAVSSNAAHGLSLSLSPGHNQTQLPLYDALQSDALASIPDLTYVVGDKRSHRPVNIGYGGAQKHGYENAFETNLQNYINDTGSRYSRAHMHSQPDVDSICGVFPPMKYLKAAQNLLNELVSVQDAIKQNNTHSKPRKTASWASCDPASNGDIGGLMKVISSGDSINHVKEHTRWGLSIEKSATCPDLPTNSVPVNLTPEGRQELQFKKAKLTAMLQEVDQRYKLYRTQMQTIVNLFESAAGAGAARCYTALALQTISRHFRCLRDAIAGQVRVASRSLGEEDHLSHQRAFQHLHMMHQHAWRPQRGLPERAVSVLRTWLFEHFLHPYPKDTDKIMLAKRTGLTRNQVSNWFINARVRLWKPMVEEMYQEEAKEDDMPVLQGLNDNIETEREERTVASATARRKVDSNLLETLNVDHLTGVQREGDTQVRQLSGAGTMTQHNAVQGTATSVDWQDAKKARNFADTYGRRVPMYPNIQSDEDKQSMAVMRAVNPESLNPIMSNRTTTKGASGSTTVSLTLGLQHRDPVEATIQQQQQQQQHLFYNNIEQPSYGHPHSVLQNVPQGLPEFLLERISTADASSYQNYLNSMPGSNLEILSQLQSQKPVHGQSLHHDFA
ncbi:hypothetical protein KP509_12G073900 [Ceratopteris richardii]|uniref:Homeobox domain-containing protein n=1 Tax=Ceratopteris richardii TaxID=49495 RepID=A0A8T2TMS4_CERRI|nr:hypothetical protein KP509_12G073900 [Ceratopteris richardii]KAH7423788.1 hypothetical protein KP509_12G073900 [Ceratopteris richardii]